MQFHRKTTSPSSRSLRQKTTSADEDMDEYIKMQLSPEPECSSHASCSYKQDGCQSQVTFDTLDKDVSVAERGVENIYERIQ